ncbi:hypothetical protein O0I10_012206 [Lichtheimia ornata]|uniref:Translocon-associated protein subunit alpha n=1 Tax=Lichtheimia ornata TaxID=688661 RepID=A0AAD7XT91_9FUNG|nr:uncharacterized protein O0I10_012206 [Lichtheimia ornata]KAJ8652148.1 hypothetical protein O0I10_012206 [Lichtheimia ornata]
MAKLSSFWTLLFLVIACTSLVFAQDEQQENPIITADLDITAQFPDNPFGLIVNGQRNKVLLSVTNKEDVDYSVLAVSAKVSHPDNPDKILRNLTALRYDLNIPAEGTVEIPYAFYSEFAPGELALTVFVDVLGGEKIVRVTGYDGLITITDPETSWLDPQLIFLYIVLGAISLGVGYIIREAFFGGAKKTKTKKASKEPAVQPSHRDEKGQMVLDESWIPEHHLKNSPKQSPRAKKRSNRK